MLAGLAAQAALAVVQQQGDALKARFAARRDNQADVTRLQEAASRITDVEGLLKDRRTLRLVLEAFQLESEANKIPLLRRVLTEDPADSTSYVNRLADPRWRAFAQAFATRQSTDVAGPTLTATPAAEIAALPLNRIAGLDFLQVQALTPEQIAALSPEQVAAFDPEAIGGLEPEDVAALSGTQVAALQPAQIRGLLLWQVSAIEPADIPSLSAAQIRALAPEQIGALTPEQVAAFTPEQIGAFTGRQAGAFDRDQLAVLSEADRARLNSAPFLPEEDPAPATRRPLADPKLIERIVDGAMTNRFEKSMGESSPGMREALYFLRLASQVTTIPQLMSDRALTEVARGALGIPTSFASLDFDQQKALLTRRLDLSRLQDPKEVARMAARYVATREGTAAGSTNPAVTLLSGGGTSLTTLATTRISLSL